ncbi:unnamed protein product, partial [Meganyctiphanes norvegica]
VEDQVFPPSIDPKDIVDQIRLDLESFEIADSEEEISEIEKSSYALQNLINFDKARDAAASKEIPEYSQNSKVPKLKTYRPCTQHHEAKCVIEDKRIIQVPEFHAWIIKSTDGKRDHLVKLNPKETCTCAAVTTCYHILAVKMSIGMSILPKKEPVNLTLLTKKNRRKNDGKSGRKKHRAQDVEVVPASDSIFMESSAAVSTPSRPSAGINNAKTPKGKKKYTLTHYFL